MKLSERPFHAVDKSVKTEISNIELAEDIEQYIKALFPENGIEYWFLDDKNPMDLPIAYDWTSKKYDYQIGNPVCYVYSGSNEGMRLQISLEKKGGHVIPICNAKTFGSPEEAWSMARAASEYLESIIHYGEQPLINQIYESLPKQRFSGGLLDEDKINNLTIQVLNLKDGETLPAIRLVTHDGESLYQKQSDDARYGHYFIEALLKDVTGLLDRHKLTYKIHELTSQVEMDAPTQEKLAM